MANKVEFELRLPLKYAANGEMAEEQLLLLEAPNLGSTKTKKNARRLKNLALSAIGVAQKAKSPEQLDAERQAHDDAKAKAAKSKDSKGESDEDDKPDRTMLLGMALSGVDTDPLCEAMKALAPSVVEIGETGEMLQNSLWDKLDMSDQEELVSVYLASFLGL